MAEPEKIGEWSAVQIDTLGSPRPENGPTDAADEATNTRSSRAVAFGLGLLVGFIPLIALGAALAGYLFARDDGQVVAADNSDTVSAGAAEADPGSPLATAEQSTTTEPSTSTDPSTTAELVAPSVVIDDGTVQILGSLPPESKDTYVEELTILAIALGRLPEDLTTVDDQAPAPEEVAVSFHDAVVFGQGGDVLFEEFHPILDAVAVYLNESGSEITVVSLAEDGFDQSDSLHLAQHRAGHVFDHLAEAGVDVDQISIDARAQLDVADGVEESGNRVDLVFHVEV